MRGRKLFLTATVVLSAGIVLIISNRSVSSVGVVISGGIMFILAGVLNVGVMLGRGKEGRTRYGLVASVVGWVASVAALMLGLAMLVFQSVFVPLVGFMFGVLVAFGALYQYFLFAYSMRSAGLPGWFYVVPTALVGASVYLFTLNPVESDGLIMLVGGISLTVFGVFVLVAGVMAVSAVRRAAKSGGGALSAGIDAAVAERSLDD